MFLGTVQDCVLTMCQIMFDQKLSYSDIMSDSISNCMQISYLRTSQCLGNLTDTSSNFPQKSTVCNTGTGFILCTVTFLKHFRFGRTAATTSPVPIVGQGQLIFHINVLHVNKQKYTSYTYMYTIYWHYSASILCTCMCACAFAVL